MLPNDMELQTPQKKEWSLIPADIYQTEITNIEYKEIDNKWKKEPTDPDKKQIMNFEFTIIEEGPNYGRKMWKQMAPIKPYPPTQKGKESWVYRLASAMAGHPISKGEADKYGSSDINDFHRRQVRINITESAPNDAGKQYNNIDSFLHAKQQLPPFDVNKVPKENQPADTSLTPTQPTPEPAPQSDLEPQNTMAGYDKLKAVADKLKPKEQAPESQNQTVAPDIAETAQKMENDTYPFDGVNDPF